MLKIMFFYVDPRASYSQVPQHTTPTNAVAGLSSSMSSPSILEKIRQGQKKYIITIFVKSFIVIIWFT